MSTILLATDGSPSAAAATREAITLARALDLPLLAVAVEHVTLPAYGYYGYGEIYKELVENEHLHAQRILAETAHQADEEGVDCETVAAKGPVVEEICRIASEHDARLIVIGAHGWGPIRSFFFGSVSTGVLHSASCPVLVVRGDPAAEIETEQVHADAAAI